MIECTTPWHRLACAIGLACSFALTGISALSDERPNTIFCMGDNHGWDETGYNGHPYLKTPVKADSPTNPGAIGFNPWLWHDNFFELNPTLSHNGGPPKRFPSESSEILIDETIRFIGNAKKRRQAFVAVVWFGSRSVHNSLTGADDP